MPACSRGKHVLDCALPRQEPYVSESMPSLPEVEAAGREHGLACGGSELHGGLCGWLAGGGQAGPDWPARVMADEGLEAVAPGGVLDRLGRATAAQMEDQAFGFDLLLPDPEAPLYARSGALFEWCRGFVGAFGLAAGPAPPLSEEGAEALADLVRLAAAMPEGGGDQEGELALADVEEAVRVPALRLHGACALGPRPRGRPNGVPRRRERRAGSPS